jgi:VanZ family protein
VTTRTGAGARGGPWRALLVAYLLFFGSVLVGAYLGILPTEPARLPLFDTLGHFVLFGVGALLLDRAWGGRVIRRRLPFGTASLPAAVLVVGAFAVAEECAQLLSPVRSFDPTDLLASVAGAVLLGWVAARRLRR